MKYKTIVIGSGRLGANIASLLSKRGNSVDIIDKDPDAFRKIPDDFSGNTYVGDGTDLSTLDSIGLKEAKRVVIVTGDDNYNIYLAHVASNFYDVPLIYVRLFDVSKGKLIDESRIKVIYPFNLSIDEFLHFEGGNLT